MDTVIKQLDDQNKSNKSILKIFYKIYYFVAKILLYSLFIILFLIAIAFVAYFIDMERNIKNGVTKQPLFGTYVIISPSMVPTINVEDAIVIKRAEENELKVGDIITFLSSDPRYSGLTITHRIVGVEKSKSGEVFFRTKGDNNNSEDTALVKTENIYGKVMLRIPKIGYIQYFLTKSYGWIIVVVIPCLCVVIYDILKIIKSIKNGSSKKKKINDNSDDLEIIGEEEKTKIVDSNDDIEILSDDGDENGK